MGFLSCCNLSICVAPNGDNTNSNMSRLAADVAKSHQGNLFPMRVSVAPPFNERLPEITVVQFLVFSNRLSNPEYSDKFCIHSR
jgi:hypothetical protein